MVQVSTLYFILPMFVVHSFNDCRRVCLSRELSRTETRDNIFSFSTLKSCKQPGTALDKVGMRFRLKDKDQKEVGHVKEQINDNDEVLDGTRGIGIMENSNGRGIRVEAKLRGSFLTCLYFP